jgi:hypothetical protein
LGSAVFDLWLGSGVFCPHSPTGLRHKKEQINIHFKRWDRPPSLAPAPFPRTRIGHRNRDFGWCIRTSKAGWEHSPRGDTRAHRSGACMRCASLQRGWWAVAFYVWGVGDVSSVNKRWLESIQSLSFILNLDQKNSIFSGTQIIKNGRFLPFILLNTRGHPHPHVWIVVANHYHQT